jgi:tetratricopeptide (TPR) repeat protein/tRNA A-37 threonylcarbamoyl transferase component Bud32
MNPSERLDELLDRWEVGHHLGRAVAAEELCRDCPELLPELQRQISVLLGMAEVVRQLPLPDSPAPPAHGDQWPANPPADRVHDAGELTDGPDPDSSSPDHATLPVPQPSSPPGLPPRAGRYLVQEQIAVGGMGAVLRVRDPAFERTLAVKVMLPQAAGQLEAVKRFLEEARITGRLQHPGIPPVHELGQLDSGMPFFAMKLIKGQTLAALLRQRQGTADDLPRWIGIFRQVCQTLAYAHSRGIIHRDLKPHNVMVGAFGEVQVMDWGLAKAIARLAEEDPDGPGQGSTFQSVRRSQDSTLSQTGDVMGTLGYMAPEAARGEIRTLDERCDVFGLGAILCEVLTGQPPFWKGSSLDRRLQAADGKVDEAFGRLDNCGADAELVGLARRCLAPKKEDRPRHAGQMAEAVECYEAQVQERLRQADLARGKAQVQAEEQRKRAQVEKARAVAERGRRRAVAAAAAVALLLVAGAAGAALWYQQGRAEQAAREKYLRQEVSAGLAETERQHQELHGKLSDPLQVHELLSDIDQWHSLVRAGQAALAKTQALARSEPALLGEDLTEQLQQASKQQQTVERDYQLARKLDDIRLQASTMVEGKFDTARAVAKYVGAFAEADYHVSQADVGPPAARIGRSPIRYALVAALDFWAATTRDRPLGRRLLLVARRADPDPWRDQMREALGGNDVHKLQRLSEQVDVSRQSPQMLLAVAWRLPRTDGQAAALLRRSLDQYPRDFWLHFSLGGRAKDPAEMAGCYRAALALRPNSSVAHVNLGVALYAQRDYAGAITHYQHALKLDPKDAIAHDNWGNALAAQQDYAGAIHHYRQALQLDPKGPNPHNSWGIALHAQQDYAGAVHHYRQALQLDPKFALAHNGWGAVLVAQRDYAAAIHHCQEALRLDPKGPNPHNSWGNALYAQQDYAGAIHHYRHALQLDSKFALAHNGWGAVLVAQRDYASAIDHFQQALQLDPKYPEAHSNWGNALRAQKDYVGAIRHYQQALQFNPKFAPAHNGWGLALESQQDYAGAIHHYQQALHLDPNDAMVHSNWGLALAHQKDYAGAIRHYRQALQLDPELAEAHCNWGAALAAQQDYAGAIHRCQEALRFDPNLALAHSVWGYALYGMKDYAGAISHSQQALKLDPKNALAYCNWGAALAAQQDYAGAATHCRQALKLDPNFAAAHFYWGWSLVFQRDYAGAVTHFQHAVKLDPSYGEAHGALGFVLLTRGYFTDAEQTIRRCLQLLRPGHPMRSAAQKVLHDCQRALQLEQQALALAHGKVQSTGPTEMVRLAQFCHQYRRHPTAVRLYSSALAAQPPLADDLKKEHLFRAACAAALSAAGQGHKAVALTEKERGELRQQALHWLQANLKLWKEELQKEMSLSLALTDVQLARWQTEPALAELREEKELVRLPKEEQQAWQQLWADVAQVLKQVRRQRTLSQVEGKLTVHKKEQMHEVYMKAGRTYVIDQRPKSFDAFLRLEDASGKKLSEDKDSGGPQEAQIIFTAPQDGSYRLVASSFQQQGIGTYTLVIREFAGLPNK